jgi:hypothetical protein
MEIRVESHTESNLQPTDEGERDISLDLFVRQVNDRALPAGQVLTEQRDCLDPDLPIPIFVP